MSPSVLITGTQPGGLGYALALSFHRRGFHVIATDWKVETAQAFEGIEGVDFALMDVTSAKSIDAVWKFITDTLQVSQLAYIVNNAGRGYYTPLIHADIEESKNLFDVNVWGAMSVIRRFFPLVQNAKGTIVNIASVGGALNTPWLGIYAASKAAIACFSETLRLECRLLDVNVATIMLGTMASRFYDHNPSINLPRDSPFQELERFMIRAAAGKDSPKPVTPEQAAEQILSHVLAGATGKIWVGGQATVTRIFINWMPTWITDYFLSKSQGLDVFDPGSKTKAE